jgi:hypothetical protein
MMLFQMLLLLESRPHSIDCKWFHEMKKEGCPPNVVTYTTLVHDYQKMGKISEVNEYLAR